MPGWHTSQTGRGRGVSGDVPTGLNGLFANALAQQEIRVIEILEEIGEECITVCSDSFLDSLENTAVHAFRIIRRFQQERRNPGDDYRLADALRSVFRKVARHFATTHRETDQCEIAELELRHEFVQVLSEGVVVVAGSWLAGLAESSAVIGDDTVSRRQKRCDLLLPGSATQWISVNKNNRVTRAMVLIIEIDVAGVFRTDRSEWHIDSPRLSAGWGLTLVGWAVGADGPFRLCVRLCRACSPKPVFRIKSQRVMRGCLRSNRDCRNGTSPTRSATSDHCVRPSLFRLRD